MESFACRLNWEIWSDDGRIPTRGRPAFILSTIFFVIYGCPYRNFSLLIAGMEVLMIEFVFYCHNCANKNSILIPEDENYNLICNQCNSVVAFSSQVNGFIYALQNDSMPGLLKIGFTSRRVEDRVLELNSSTSTPTPFNVLFYFASSNPARDESIAHAEFESCRVNKNREFFKIDADVALSTLREKLNKTEIFVNRDIVIECMKDDICVDSEIINDVLVLKSQWLITKSFDKAADFVQNLINKQNFADAKAIVNLFIDDFPDNELALEYEKIVEDEIFRNEFNKKYLKSCNKVIVTEVLKIKDRWSSYDTAFTLYEMLKTLMQKNLFDQVLDISDLFINDIEGAITNPSMKRSDYVNLILEIRQLNLYSRNKIAIRNVKDSINSPTLDNGHVTTLLATNSVINLDSN